MNHDIRNMALVCTLALSAACAPEPADSVAKAPPAATSTTAPQTEVAPAVPTLNMLAPDIVGEDIDGQPIRLSDYRGKVVMLDFWGHW
ncbi:MAG: hypothetical protein SGI72_12865 [Planctomycetota bacterium]|nr:hypothetical protein [Planctomycetota bacterium]